MASNRNLPKGIYLKPNGLYEGRFRYQGESYTIYGKNIKKLEKDLANLRYEVERGKGKGDNMLLNAWFETWPYDYKSETIKESTRVRYEDYYRMYIRPSLGQKKMSQFNPIIIQRHLNQIASTGYSTKTIADTYNILHSMFKLAVQNDILYRNPCDAVFFQKQRKGKDVYWR